MFTLKVLFLCLTVTVVFCEYENQKSNDTMSLTNCYLQSKMSRDEFRKIVLGSKNNNLPIPITQPEKCFVDCMMRTENMIISSKISVGVMIKSAVSFYGRHTLNAKLIYKRVEEIINGCVKKVSDQSMTEECAVAASVYTCMMEEAHKAGLTDQNGRPVAPQK